MFLLPPAFLLAMELALRVAGFGSATDFLLPNEISGRQVWMQNDRFGWRFFSRNQAREPQALCLARQKPARTIRIFVFGESAAYGDPQPAFGLPRLLQVMLQGRYPQARFEVVNAAMTGINSHVLRDIARDCVVADGDIWVVYAGNNEVVGPFGAGTVFGQQTPSLGFIRTSLALKRTRTGQLLDGFVDRLRPSPGAQGEWGGMMMFLDQSVPADDPRLNRVYEHFQKNLADLIAVGRRAGVGVLLSTVAVNLKDCAPFASAHRASLTASRKVQWDEVYARGIQAHQSGNLRAALASFDEAARLDDAVAELHFRRGQCARSLGQTAQAQRDFARARDLDILRFRCDTRINQIIRDMAARTGATLADAETLLAANSPDGIPGREFFYEHVHLSWEGNYLLARTLAERLVTLLPAGVTTDTSARTSWPTSEDCARRLAWSDRNRHAGLLLMLGRLQDPPFTHQFDHPTRMRELTEALERLSPALQPDGLREALRGAETAAAEAPEDAVLQAELAELCRLTGDLDGATKAARRVVQLLPFAQPAWAQLGMIQAQAQRDNEAQTALQTALNLDPDNVWTRNDLAQLHLRVGRKDDALREFRRVVAHKPRFGSAHLGVGQILEERGQAEEAETHYRLALENRIHRAADLGNLARFCLAKGWWPAAVTNFQDALKLGPANVAFHRELAQALLQLGRDAEAQSHLTIAARLDPSAMPARFQLGVELGRQGRHAEAAVHFQEVVRLTPDLIEGRLNLGEALASQGLVREALEQFEEVLRRSPTNRMALERVQVLRAQAETRNREAP